MGKWLVTEHVEYQWLVEADSREESINKALKLGPVHAYVEGDGMTAEQQPDDTTDI